MKSKTLIFAILLCSQSALAADWTTIGNKFKDAGEKLIKAAERAGERAKDAAEPHAEKIAQILADAAGDVAKAAEDAANEL